MEKAKERCSTSMLEQATTSCFFEHQEIQFAPRKTQ